MASLSSVGHCSPDECRTLSLGCLCAYLLINLLSQQSSVISQTANMLLTFTNLTVPLSQE